MKLLTYALNDLPEFKQLLSAIDGGACPAAVSGLAAVHRAHLAAALRANMSPSAALAYLVFILFYFPCIATIVAIKHESGGWKWALFTAVYTTLVAVVAALAVYHLF